MTRKYCVEECLDLDIRRLKRRVQLVNGATGVISWHPEGTQEALLTYAVEDDIFYPRELSWHLAPEYACRPFDFDRSSADGSGAKRVMFVCLYCGKEVYKLYLPPGKRHFGCRSCHALSYASRQRRMPEEAKLLKRLDELKAYLRDPLLGSARWMTVFREYEQLAGPFDIQVEKPPRNREQRRALTDQLTAWDEDYEDPQEPRKERSAKRRSVLAQQGVLCLRPRGNPHAIPKDPHPQPSERRGPGRPKTKRSYQRTKPFTTSMRADDSEGLCMRCRVHRKLLEPQPRMLRNGPSALVGRCPVCGATMVLIVTDDEIRPSALSERNAQRRQQRKRRGSGGEGSCDY